MTESENSLNQMWEEYRLIQMQVTELHILLDIFKTLYAESENRVQLLNHIAPAFFGTVQNSVALTIALNLCKLTDSRKSSSKDNLVLWRLMDFIGENGNKELADSLEAQKKKIEGSMKQVKDVRNKRIAHNDLLTFLQSQHSPVVELEHQWFSNALSAIVSFLDTIDIHYEDATNYYPPVDGSAPAIIEALKRASAYEELLMSHQVTFDDLSKSKYFDV